MRPARCWRPAGSTPTLYSRLYVDLRQGLAAYDDRLFTVPAGQATSFDTLVERRGQSLRLVIPPERIVFIEA